MLRHVLRGVSRALRRPPRKLEHPPPPTHPLWVQFIKAGGCKVSPEKRGEAFLLWYQQMETLRYRELTCLAATGLLRFCRRLKANIFMVTCELGTAFVSGVERGRAEVLYPRVVLGLLEQVEVDAKHRRPFASLELLTQVLTTPGDRTGYLEGHIDAIFRRVQRLMLISNDCAVVQGLLGSVLYVLTSRYPDRGTLIRGQRIADAIVAYSTGSGACAWTSLNLMHLFLLCAEQLRDVREPRLLRALTIMFDKSKQTNKTEAFAILCIFRGWEIGIFPANTDRHLASLFALHLRRACREGLHDNTLTSILDVLVILLHRSRAARQVIRDDKLVTDGIFHGLMVLLKNRHQSLLPCLDLLK